MKRSSSRSTARIAHTTVGGVYKPSWVDFKVIVGVPHDMPIVGYGGETVNVLRLFTARSSDEFDIGIFNSGDYIAAVQHKINTEAISKILYPVGLGRPRAASCGCCRSTSSSPAPCATSSSATSSTHDSFDEFAEKVAIQMNDTHPALTVAELMRMFIDDYGLPWEQAWAITVATCGYTNHTLLPEALEKWPFDLLERLLPRHLQIMQEINRRLLAEVERRFPGRPGDAAARLALRRRRSPQRAHGATWPWPAATRSTASPRCTRSW